MNIKDIEQYIIYITDAVDYGHPYIFTDREGNKIFLQSRKPFTKLRGVKYNGRRPDIIYCPKLWIDKDPEWFHTTLTYCVSNIGIIVQI